MTRIFPGLLITRVATQLQNPDMGDCSSISSSTSCPETWCGGLNGKKTAPRSQWSRTGASVSDATRPITRLSAMAGPVYWILAKLENQSIPRPMTTVPALATRAPPTCSIASRSAETWLRPRASSSR